MRKVNNTFGKYFPVLLLRRQSVTSWSHVRRSLFNYVKAGRANLFSKFVLGLLLL